MMKLRLVFLFFFNVYFLVYAQQVYISPELEILAYDENHNRIELFVSKLMDHDYSEKIYNEILQLSETDLPIKDKIIDSLFLFTIGEYDELPSYLHPPALKDKIAKMVEIAKDTDRHFANMSGLSQSKKEDIKARLGLLKDWYFRDYMMTPELNDENLIEYFRQVQKSIISEGYFKYERLGGVEKFLLLDGLTAYMKREYLNQVIIDDDLKNLENLKSFFKSPNDTRSIFRIKEALIQKKKGSLPVSESYVVKTDGSVFEITPPFPKVALNIDQAIEYESALEESVSRATSNEMVMINPHYHVSIKTEDVPHLDKQKFKNIAKLYKILNATNINGLEQYNLDGYPKDYTIFTKSKNGFLQELKSKGNVKLIDDGEYGFFHMEIRNMARINPTEKKKSLKELVTIVSTGDYQKSLSQLRNGIMRGIDNSNFTDKFVYYFTQVIRPEEKHKGQIDSLVKNFLDPLLSDENFEYFEDDLKNNKKLADSIKEFTIRYKSFSANKISKKIRHSLSIKYFWRRYWRYWRYWRY